MSKKPSLLSSRLHRDSEVQSSSTFERPHYVDKLFETPVVKVTKNSKKVAESVDIKADNNVVNDIDSNVSDNVDSDNVDGNNSNDVDNDIAVDKNVNDANVYDKISDSGIIIVSKKKDDKDRLKRVSYYLKPSTDKLIVHNAKLAGLGKSEFLQNLLDKVFEKLEIHK